MCPISCAQPSFCGSISQRDCPSSKKTPQHDTPLVKEFRMKTSELTRTALDWAVATALGRGPKYDMKSHGRTWCDWWLAAPGHEYEPMPSYSTDWFHGGVLIEREKLCLDIDSAGVWLAWTKQNYDDEPRHMVSGPTPLIAAMRCYVASKLGDNVELPEGLN